MTRNFYIFIICLLANIAYADNNSGIDFYKVGEPDIAQKLFFEQLNSSPAEKAVALYYIGEIAFDTGRPAEALDYYKQGWETNPEYAFNKVGEGKILLKTDRPAAEKAFAAAVKVNKKNAETYVAIASAYSTNGMEAEAATSLENARKLNPNAPAIFLYEGDRLLAQNKPGDAAGKYEQAIHSDPDCRIAYIRYAEVYQGVTPSLSIEMLQKVLANHPEFLLAKRTLGNIYSLQGAYAKAAEAYAQYMAGGLYSVTDLVHYVSALFFDKQHGKAAEVLVKGKAMAPDNFLLKRLSFYNACETGKYQEGLDEAVAFFQTSDGKFIWQDYLYYGRLLNEARQYDQSLTALLQAQALCDSNAHPEIYKDIANVSLKNGNDNAAIEAYTKYIEQIGETAEAADFYQLGKYYYGAAVKDSTLATGYLAKADSLFAIVKERVPSSPLGLLRQARTHSLLDPETENGLAKPYYEACIPMFEKNQDKYRKELAECYRYLGYYYYLRQEMDCSKLYWNKLLDINPSDQTALEALKNIK